MNHTGKVVIGTGKGIGRSIAIMYATHGAKLVIAEQNPKNGLETQHFIERAGGQATFLLTDVSDVITRKQVALINKKIPLMGIFLSHLI